MPASSSAFLNVTDIAKSLEFYRGLGFRVDRTHERDGVVTYADLSLEGADFGLGNIHSNDDAAFRNWVGTPLGAGVVVYFTVPRVDKCWDAAQRTGATIEYPLEDRSYGRVFTLNDPDGYTLTFLEEPRKARPARRPAAAVKAKAKAKVGKAKPARRAAPKRRK